MPSAELAVIISAGRGERRDPITRVVDKNMLVIGNRPVVDYSVTDAILAGVTDITHVVRPGSTQIEAFYGDVMTREQYFRLTGQTHLLEKAKDLNANIRFRYKEQRGKKYGTAVPVAMFAGRIGAGEWVLVTTGDDFLYNSDDSSDMARLVQAVDRSQADAGLLYKTVAESSVRNYGIIEMAGLVTRGQFDRILDRPEPSETNSRRANVSTYLFDAVMFGLAKEHLSAAKEEGQEYLLTDVINEYAQYRPIQVVEAQGVYLDAGTPQGHLNAWNTIAAAGR